jgi:hypothetical protein
MKIILTESQKKRLISEQIPEDVYNDKVKLSFYLNNAKYNGLEIDDIDSIETRIQFKIDIQYKRWGIESAYVYDIKGHDTEDFIIRVYPEGSDDYVEHDVTLKLDWENLIKETEVGSSISVNNEIECTLGNNENGDLIIQSMTIVVYGFS